jgi:5-bromo-4-chloroindolyl phosphate hydrolysis protein
MSDERPREWWIKFDSIRHYTAVWTHNVLIDGAGQEVIHVIEKSAYDKALERIAELEATEKVYHMNREWIETAKERIAELEKLLEEKARGTKPS